MGVWFKCGLPVLIGLVLWSCSAIDAPSEGVWTAQPEFRGADNQLFNARLEPRKGEAPYYAFFLLTIVNKSDGQLVLDWNESRYLLNGKPQGMLVFQGVDPQTVKNATIPVETIPPGGRFSRELMPLRLIAWNPVKAETANQPGITPGMLPAGENGIRLVFRQASGPVTLPLTVRISRQTTP